MIKLVKVRKLRFTALLLGISICTTGAVATTLLYRELGHLFHFNERPGPLKTGAIELHNGWRVQPSGYSATTADMPSLMTFSPDGKYAVVGTSGWHSHTLNVFAIGSSPQRTPDGVDRNFRTEPTSSITVPNAWRGICFGKGKYQNELFVSGGKSHLVWRFRFDSKLGFLHELPSVSIPASGSVAPGLSSDSAELPRQANAVESYPGGLSILPDGKLLVIDEAADRGPQHSDLLYKIDPESGLIVGKAKLTLDAGAMTIDPSGEKVFVAEHGAGRVLVLNASDLKQVADIPVGSQPNFLLADSKMRVFCANTGSDTISVIDTTRNEVVQTIKTGPTAHAPLGSVPNAISISPDQKTLYVTNAGNNDVAVIDLKGASAKVKGFIPTGWYPVSIGVAPKNDWLFVGVGKGFRAFSNPTVTPDGIAYTVGQNPGQAYGPKHDRLLSHDYIMSGLRGGLTRLPIPSESELADETRVALSSIRYRDSQLLNASNKLKGSVLPDRVGVASPFEHVLYIIKENRTYDQVLGDVAKGDGDPNLVLYGRNVTPNHHAIAEQFVLLDNVYCDGEVSQDGWEWSTAANDSDWDIKATTLSYSGRGDPPGSRETIRPSNGYLWEWMEQQGKTYYSYGAKTFAGLFSPTWKGHFSEEWNETRRIDRPDYLKADLFIRDLAQAEKSGNWPNLVVMSLTDDHTAGTRPGSRTPYASVGSNDLAIGKIVDAVSHSKFWAKTAIFIIEDDAQNGPDHVDAHRTVALVASPYTQRGSVDHTMYTSSGMVRSIELCLGLRPTSQYDASANPMFGCFTGKKDLSPFVHLPATVDLNALNSRQSPMAKESAALDFSDVDRANWETLNRVLWASAKPGQPYPGSFSSYLR